MLASSAPRRYLATDKTNSSTMAAAQPAVAVEPEIGPSAPELQLTNLTGDHERTFFDENRLSCERGCVAVDVLEITLNRPERRNALGRELLTQVGRSTMMIER